MNQEPLSTFYNRHRISGMRWMQATAVALALAMAVSARAADERAIKSRVAPVYPELAKRMKISGMVKVEATVDAEGKVTAVKTVSGSRALSAAAEDAVSKWRFAVASAPSTVDVDVNFTPAQ
ncbi:MAG: energy transducer TonB [Terracidiphilus sp.]|jgi:TonB family protein